MHGQTVTDDHISLTDVAKTIPGRPTANCIWRWCRRGVLARNGARIRLQHIRLGGRIFTTRAWLEAFGRQLADADAHYFDLSKAVMGAQPPQRQTSRVSDERRQAIEQAERELDDAGI